MNFGHMWYHLLVVPICSWDSEVTTLWPTIIEVVNITESIGGPEPDSFSEVIANEAIRKWNEYRLNSTSAPGRMNDAFFHYQMRMFESHRQNRASSVDYSRDTVTWLELQNLPEYRRLRGYMEWFGMRYLERIGHPVSSVDLFSWAAVHSDSDHHGPHTHTGELLVGVYYASVTGSSGRLRLFDPRGPVPPFGKTYDFDCQSGQMIFFPSWLQHAALPTKQTSNDHRVIFAFNIGVGGIGALKSMEWHLDPISNFQNTVKQSIHETDDECDI